MASSSTPVNSLKRNGSIRSILKRSTSREPDRNAQFSATPARVTFTASTVSPPPSSAAPSKQQTAEATYTLDENGLPRFYAVQDQTVHVIHDTPVHEPGLRRTPSKLDLLFEDYNIEALSPPVFNTEEIGESTSDIPDHHGPSFPRGVQGKTFLSKLIGTGHPESSLAASTLSLLGHSRTESSNIFDATLPAMHQDALTASFGPLVPESADLSLADLSIVITDDRTATTSFYREVDITSTGRSPSASPPAVRSPADPATPQKREDEQTQTQDISSMRRHSAPFAPAAGSFGRSGARGGAAKIAAMLAASEPDIQARSRSPSKPMSRSLPQEWTSPEAVPVSFDLSPQAEREGSSEECELSVEQSRGFATAPTTPALANPQTKPSKAHQPTRTSKDDSFDDAYASLFHLQADLMDNADSHKSLLLAFIQNLQRDLQDREDLVAELTEAKENAEQGWNYAIEQAAQFERQMLDQQSSLESQMAEKQQSEWKAEISHLKELLDTEREEHNKDTSRKSQQIEKGKETLRDVQSAKEKLSVDIAILEKTMQSEIESAEQRIQQVTEESQQCINELEDEVEACREQIADLETQIRDVVHEKQRQRIELEQEQVRQSATAAQSQSLIDRLRSDLRALEEEKRPWAEAIVKHQQESQNNEERMKTLSVELAAEKQSKNEASAQMRTMREQANELQASHSAVAAQMQETQIQLDGANQELIKLGQLKSDLESNIRKRNIDEMQLQQRLKSAEDSLYRMEEGSTMQLDAIDSSRQRNEELEQQHRQTLHELADLQQAQITKDEHILALQQKLHAAEEQSIAVNQAQLKSMQASISQLKAANSTADSRVARLEKRNVQLQEDLDGMSIGLDAKQVEIQLLKRQLRDNGQHNAIGLTPAVKKAHRPSVGSSYKVAETPLARHSAMIHAVSSTVKKPSARPRRISFGAAPIRGGPNTNFKRTSSKPTSAVLAAQLINLPETPQQPIPDDISSEYETATFA